jgi:pyridoxal phosphate enzyme (YggS family)
MIADNIKAVTQRIARSCDKAGRPAGDVELVCVTKEATLAQMEEALQAGGRVFGENRVQDAAAKHKAIGDKASWHLVGHLQTNKVKEAVGIFDLIHSVDSAHLARQIDKEAGKASKVQDILIQVNTSGEATKFGVSPEAATDLIKEVALYPNIHIKGLMTIAPEVEDPETVRPYFRALRDLRDRIDGLKLTAYSLHLLSMGMTNDFEVAIEEGSTMVRIGRAIFR